MTREAKVGFGEASRTHRTVNMNAFARFETAPVSGGADIRIVARGDHAIMPEIDADTGEVILRLRRDAGPQPGRWVMVGKRLVKVRDRRYDHKGNLQVQDEDGAWVLFDQGGKQGGKR